MPIPIDDGEVGFTAEAFRAKAGRPYVRSSKAT
jgi:hypothetical protein